MESDRTGTIEALRAAGVVAAEEEADDLVAVARSSEHSLSMVARRLTGEPTAWIVESTRFLGMAVTVKPGVYVPRWQTESVALHAVEHLPDRGTALDLCTGSGAVGAYLLTRNPSCRVIGTDIDAVATACARANGVEAYLGDLFAPLPLELRREIDLVVAVPPYVPEAMLRFLPRDVVAFEPIQALVGGESGLDVVGRIIAACTDWLRPGGSLVVEVGVDQVHDVAERMAEAALSLHGFIYDEDGDACGACASTSA